MRPYLALLGCALLAGCEARQPPSAVRIPTASAPALPSAPTAATFAAASSTPSPTAADVVAPPSPGPTGTPLSGELLYTRYPGLLVDQEVPLIIYLPPGYQWTPGMFPAIYLIHGIGYDQSQWVDLELPALLDARINSGAWEPVLLVMPYAPENLFRRTDGGPASYEDEVLHGLMPYVQRNFRADPEQSALAGISRGGVWALEIGLRNPASFVGVAALSPALNVNRPREQFDPFQIAAEQTEFPSVIYLDAGAREPGIRDAVQQFSQLLDELGVSYELNLGSGGHTQNYWSTVAPQALTALIKGFQAPPPPESVP